MGSDPDADWPRAGEYETPAHGEIAPCGEGLGPRASGLGKNLIRVRQAVEYLGEWDLPLNRALYTAFDLYMRRR